MGLFSRKKPTEPGSGKVIPKPDECRSPHEAESVMDLAVLLSQQDDFQEILRLIATKGLALFNADRFSVQMLNPSTQDTIKTLIRSGTIPDERSARLLGINVGGWVMKHRKSFLSEDLPNDPRFARDLFADSKICSVLCVPMVNEKQICGSILVTAKDRARCFTQKDLEFLEKCAAVWGGFLNNARRVQEFFREAIPDDVLVSKYSALGLLGRSRRFKELIRSVDAASRCDVRVFLEGPSGSGKELVARIIHALGLRSQHPFVAIDCGAIPEHLVESELFGHVKGAFTGASQNRKGLMEEAHLGTLFMDEIGNLPYDLQSKLLRAVQEGEVRAIGSNQTRKVDVRIITASRTPAAKLLKDRTLREDLFYRLHVYPISIPTLNERSEDIPLLAEHFLKVYALRQQKKLESFHPALVHFMQGKIWPGNVREMENFVERMVTLAESDKTMLDHSLLPGEYQHEFRAISLNHVDHSTERPLRESLREYEGRILQEALIAHGWNQSAAARALHISERDIRYKMAELGIRKPDTCLQSNS